MSLPACLLSCLHVHTNTRVVIFFGFILSNFLSFVLKIVACGFHKHDKLGRPCYIEHTGRMDIMALLKVGECSY